jgi:uroporphyrinogen-III synthase
MLNKTSTTHSINLHELGVLITRPAHQANTLCNLIQTHNGRTIMLPALIIEPVIDGSFAQQLLSQIWDIAIYTSPNAVQFATQLYPTINSHSIIAIGNATATALITLLQRKADFIPKQQDSEGLLALPILTKPMNKQILIIRGKGGRTLLNEILVQRGANVSIAETYQRSTPNVDTNSILANWKQNVQVVIATSGEILDNLVLILNKEPMKLFHTPLITVSERLYHHAKNLGFTTIIRANDASDTELLITLNNFAQKLCPTF